MGYLSGGLYLAGSLSREFSVGRGGGGVCLEGLSPGRSLSGLIGATEVGGTHPTGMHSCILVYTYFCFK